jgi:hypothetical protein
VVTGPSSFALWHATDLTILMHVERGEAPESGRCARCGPDGGCPLLGWAVRVRAGEQVSYPYPPAAPLDLRAA